MLKKEMKQLINKKLESLITSDFNDIERKMKNKKGVILEMKEETTHNYKGMVISFVSMLIMIIGFFVIANTKENLSIATISFDVNPSIEIKVNTKLKVLKVLAKNEDAVKILGNMSLEDNSLEVATNALLGSMLSLGYISNDSNSILVSIYDSNKRTEKEIKNLIKSDVNSYLNDNNIAGSIITQVLKDDKNLKKTAEKYNISIGKAKLIQKIVLINPLYDFEILSKLSMNELNLLMSSEKYKVEDVSVMGYASENDYIGNDKAQKIALNHKKIDINSITNLETIFEYEDGVMVYDVEFIFNDCEYDYKINALNGKIIDFEIDEKKIQEEIKNKINSNENSKTYLSKDAVKTIVLNKEKILSYTNYDIDFELISGVGIFEIDFETEEKEYEYLLNASSGEIIYSKVENKDEDDNDRVIKEIGNESNKITISDAKNIVMEKSGVKKYFNYEIEVDSYEGQQVYEISFETEEKEYEYIVDLNTGKIVFSKIENNDFDDDND